MLGSFNEEIRSARSILADHGELEVVPKIIMSDLSRFHVDLENVIQDIKALNMHTLVEGYQQFKSDFDNASVKFKDINEAITGIGEIKLC